MDSREDSRTRAYAWIVTNLPSDARILLDEYGPILQPGPAAVARERERLEGLPEGEAFTRHQRARLDLLDRHPAPDGMDFEELAHPSWRSKEADEARLRRTLHSRSSSNPMKVRRPRTLDEYRAAGFRYVITNTEAQSRYRQEGAEKAFPSFVRFYRELEALEPLVTVDPAEWRGKGPVVRVYDLR